jgi:hypothetical protein
MYEGHQTKRQKLYVQVWNYIGNTYCQRTRDTIPIRNANSGHLASRANRHTMMVCATILGIVAGAVVDRRSFARGQYSGRPGLR